MKITDDSDIGASALSTGYDIRFTSDNGTTLLDYEKELFSISGGLCNAVFWVKIPSLSSTAETIIYLYYGDSDSVDGENKTGVWDDGENNNYTLVTHANQDPSGTITDSTSYGNNGTPAGSMTSDDLIDGRFGKALEFDGTDDTISFANATSLNPTSAFTVEAVVKVAVTTNNQTVAKHGWNASGAWSLNTSGAKWLFQLKNTTGTVYSATPASEYISTGSWLYLVGVFDGSNIILYINGVQKASNPTTGSIGISSAFTLITSAVGSAITVDDFQFSNIARSSDYITTRNNNYTTTFYNIGTEELSSPTINPTVIEFNEDNEMKQFVGTTRKHPVRAFNDSTGAPVNTLATPTFYISVNGENRQELSLTISEFDALHQWFWLTIPSTLGTITPVDGDEISITFGDGTASGFAMIQFEDEKPTTSEIWGHTTRTITEVPTGAALTTDITSLNNISSSDVQSAVAAAINADDVIRILDIIMSGTFTITTGTGGAFTATYTGRSPDTSTITFSVDGNGQRTSTTVNLV